MAPTPARRTSPRLFHEDVIVRTTAAPTTAIDADGSISLEADGAASLSAPRAPHGEAGVVLRCWYDEEEALPSAISVDPLGLDRPLKEGEVGVIFYPSGIREILREEEVEVKDRGFQVGDIARFPTSNRSGIVTDVQMELDMRHVLTGQAFTKVPAAEVQNSLRILVGDHVIAQDWVGVVEEVFEEAMVEASDRRDLLRVCDVGARLSIGETQENIALHQSLPVWSRVFGPPRQVRNVVLSVKQAIVCVNWLAVNQKLSMAQEAQRPRPKRYWTSDIEQLTLVRSFSEHAHAVGDKVIFRTPDISQARGLVPERRGTDNLEVHAMHVVGTASKVHMLWQDGSKTIEDSTQLIPHLNVDEHDVWPGDFVLQRSDEASAPRVGVVQSMDPTERTAQMRIYGTATVEVVPVLEIDAHGPEAPGFGIHRGDTVLIGSKPTGVPPPLLPRLGEYEAMPDDEELHAEVGQIGMAFASMYPMECPLVLPRAPSAAIDWYGSVTDIVDDKVQVKLPDGRLVLEPFEHLSFLVDGFEGDDGLSELSGESYEDSEYDDDESEDVMWTTEDGAEVAEERDDWEDLSGDEDMEDDEEKKAKASAVVPPPQVSSTAAASEASAEVVPSPATQALPATASADMSADERWQRFSILEEAPSDHAFLKEPVVAPKKAFFSRLQREFRVLESSLPDSILVRSYEDRQDLLRVLIIGSEGTPYEDAPVLIDFALKSDYPHSPPMAHYHSWTTGDRISPNLYHDGKVCLSLLGTWAGEKSSESWNAARSSLLQLFVSIQALVLVARPYYTEPSLERTENTPEGEQNSRLYNEKSYILSRAFVRRALEHPVRGLERELAFFFYGERDTHTPGRLTRVLQRAEKLLEQADERKAAGNAQPAEEDDVGAEAKRGVDEPAVHRLSGGGAIVLRRTLVALRKLEEANAAPAA